MQEIAIQEALHDIGVSIADAKASLEMMGRNATDAKDSMVKLAQEMKPRNRQAQRRRGQRRLFRSWTT